jgi:hypothetical protein
MCVQRNHMADWKNYFWEMLLLPLWVWFECHLSLVQLNSFFFGGGGGGMVSGVTTCANCITTICWIAYLISHPHSCAGQHLSWSCIPYIICGCLSSSFLPEEICTNFYIYDTCMSCNLLSSSNLYHTGWIFKSQHMLYTKCEYYLKSDRIMKYHVVEHKTDGGAHL